MSERSISEIEENLLPEAERELDELASAYDAAEAAAEESEELFEFEPYFSVGLSELLEALKRARQWEYKLDAYERGLLTVHQLVEQVDDGAPVIKGEIRERNITLDVFADDVGQLRDAVSDDTELAGHLEDLNAEVKRQQQRLDELEGTVADAQNEAKDASVSW